MADPEPGTPEFWEQYGCEGVNEYRDCESMSADYARLRRMERRVQALAEGPTRTDGGYQPYAVVLPDGIQFAVLLDDLRAALEADG